MIKQLFIVIAVLAASFTGLSCKSIPSIIEGRQPKEKRVVEPDDDVLKEYAEVISNLYGKLKIPSLDEIPEEKFIEYKKYVNNGTAYAIVHPSYYVFFHNYDKKAKVVIERSRGDYSKNIVDMFIDDYPVGKSRILKRMKESERRERDFLKKASSRGRLIILVLPPDYNNHPEYPYRKLDEFARYLNEVTGASPSVVYVESESYKHGYMTFETLPRLNRFLKEAEVKSLLLGGGYVDLCLKDFQEEAERIQDIEKVEVLPELCTESPDHMGQDKLE